MPVATDSPGQGSKPTAASLPPAPSTARMASRSWTPIRAGEGSGRSSTGSSGNDAFDPGAVPLSPASGQTAPSLFFLVQILPPVAPFPLGRASRKNRGTSLSGAPWQLRHDEAPGASRGVRRAAPGSTPKAAKPDVVCTHGVRGVHRGCTHGTPLFSSLRPVGSVAPRPAHRAPSPRYVRRSSPPWHTCPRGSPDR